MSQVVPFRHDEQGNHVQQLAELGLRAEYFDRTVRLGEDARDGATQDDANNAPGTLDYLARVRTLRETLRTEEGWLRHDPQQSPLSVNPDKTVAIGVLLGDARTGLPGNPQPRSHRPAGVAKEALVARNQDLALFPLPPEPPRRGEVRLNDDEYARLATWYLLTYRYEARERGTVEVRSELSLPSSIGPRGKIDDWKQRILLPTIRFKKVFDYADGATDFDVPVEEW
ncbi:hypothetical protein [Streptomyces sp. S063]|uniref:hypothetical protein n=1 Tax=Streptomyces sp. S063 TaxID=2005885 RepID=UPI0013E2CEFB|nr:hypothetical protein [Streptomyces sp. S063]